MNQITSVGVYGRINSNGDGRELHVMPVYLHKNIYEPQVEQQKNKKKNKKYKKM